MGHKHYNIMEKVIIFTFNSRQQKKQCFRCDGRTFFARNNVSAATEEHFSPETAFPLQRKNIFCQKQRFRQYVTPDRQDNYL